MKRSGQVAVLAGAPLLIIAVMALSALLAVRLAATSASPGTPALEDRAFDATLVRTARTPIPRPIAALTPTTLRSAPLASSQDAGCCALTPTQPEEPVPEAQAGVAIFTLDWIVREQVTSQNCNQSYNWPHPRSSTILPQRASKIISSLGR